MLTSLIQKARNKYLIAFVTFLIVILFLGKNDLFTQLERRKELKALEQNKAHFSRLIETERNELQALEKNPASLEKAAREKYFMKKDGEELFIISEKPASAKN
jgi:cell division protein DivIC